MLSLYALELWAYVTYYTVVDHSIYSPCGNVYTKQYIQPMFFPPPKTGKKNSPCLSFSHGVMLYLCKQR